MILLITSSLRGQECTTTVGQATGERVELATTLQGALKPLRAREYLVVVVDQLLVEADPHAADAALNEAGAAVPVFVNFALSGPERLVRDVRSALRRRHKEQLTATREAESVLRSQLTEDLTGILLSSQLALAVPELPAAAQAKLRNVYQLAMSMRSRLEAAH